MKYCREHKMRRLDEQYWDLPTQIERCYGNGSTCVSGTTAEVVLEKVSSLG